ncbi:MAG: P1 family peptidase, partial [Ideonella sp.]|nr:P1 family peptidase [Ideonella sp.]
IVATDAALTKAQATKLAQMAHDGLARSINPVHSPGDGDTVFTLATGRGDPVDVATLGMLGALAAEVTARAIVRAVLAARASTMPGLPGWPAARDWPGRRLTPR